MHPRILKLQTPKGQTDVLLDGSTRSNHTLADFLANQGLQLNTRCGQRGLCKGCEVDIVAGTLIESGAAKPAPNRAKACLCEVPRTAATLDIPSRSLLAHKPEVTADFKINVPFANQPLLPPTATQDLGLAIDIGTTTVAVWLVDLSDGEMVAQASDFNGQIHYGDNVLTRIELCSSDISQLAVLQQAVVKRTLEPLILECCKTAGVEPSRVGCASLAGNTTMLHLLAGADPRPLGVYPFKPQFLEHRVLRGTEVGFGAELGHLQLHLLPSLSSYVGADLSAGVYASGMLYDEAPSLLVDVGTNGEIVLKAGDRLFGCATAAGPAFEGSGLSSGMRAVEGAISEITFQNPPFSVTAKTIGDVIPEKAIGLCGSAYVDFLAEGRRKGILQTSGRFESAFWSQLPDKYKGKAAAGRSLVVESLATRRPVTVTESDVAQLLQAKGAVAAGIVTLLKRAGMEAKDVKTLYLAGGFGMHLNLPNAIDCGLLPGFTCEQIEVVGNTALGGAYLSLLDRNALEEMEGIRRRIEIVELNLDPDFEDTFIDQLSLPE